MFKGSSVVCLIFFWDLKMWNSHLWHLLKCSRALRFASWNKLPFEVKRLILFAGLWIFGPVHPVGSGSPLPTLPSHIPNCPLSGPQRCGALLPRRRPPLPPPLPAAGKAVLTKPPAGCLCEYLCISPSNLVTPLSVLNLRSVSVCCGFPLL